MDKIESAKIWSIVISVIVLLMFQVCQIVQAVDDSITIPTLNPTEKSKVEEAISPLTSAITRIIYAIQVIVALIAIGGFYFCVF
ncbi:hypothetical protein DRP05_09960 [Archaeoglobales archaeon]|nr:MAG: hypothetical protein DRP05_09960 [Archaeoglobales archaeon]